MDRRRFIVRSAGGAGDGRTEGIGSREAAGIATRGARKDQPEGRRRRDGYKRRDVCSIFGFSRDLTGRRGRDGRPNYGDIVEYCKEGGRASAAHGAWRPREEPRFAKSGSYSSS